MLNAFPKQKAKRHKAMKSLCPSKTRHRHLNQTSVTLTAWQPPASLLGHIPPFSQENCSFLPLHHKAEDHSAPPSVQLTDPGSGMEPKPSQSLPRVYAPELGKRYTPVLCRTMQHSGPKAHLSLSGRSQSQKDTMVQKGIEAWGPECWQVPEPQLHPTPLFVKPLSSLLLARLGILSLATQRVPNNQNPEVNET